LWWKEAHGPLVFLLDISMAGVLVGGFQATSLMRQVGLHKTIVEVAIGNCLEKGWQGMALSKNPWQLIG